MKAAVLGAGGTIGPAIARDLAESEAVDALLLLDRDPDHLAAAAERLPAGAAATEVVDTADGGLAGALADVDLLVNSASYRINLDAMRACLDAGCHYVDLGGLYWMTSRQLELSDEFERAGLLALLGMGSAPGKTNLMAKAAVRELGGSADAIHVSAAGRDLDPPDGFSVPYALRTLIDELTMAPVVLRHGEPEEVEPLSDGGTVDFGDPIGRAETIHTIHSELRTFGESFGCTTATFRLSLAPSLLARLRELAQAGDDQVNQAQSEALPPSANTVAVHLVEASTGERSVRVRAVTEPHREWGIGGGVVSTATPVGAAVRLLAGGRIEARGALPAEACLEPNDVFAELEPHGCRVETVHVEEVTA